MIEGREGGERRTVRRSEDARERTTAGARERERGRERARERERERERETPALCNAAAGVDLGGHPTQAFKSETFIKIY